MPGISLRARMVALRTKPQQTPIGGMQRLWPPREPGRHLWVQAVACKAGLQSYIPPLPPQPPTPPPPACTLPGEGNHQGWHFKVWDLKEGEEAGAPWWLWWLVGWGAWSQEERQVLWQQQVSGYQWELRYGGLSLVECLLSSPLTPLAPCPDRVPSSCRWRPQQSQYKEQKSARLIRVSRQALCT